MKVHVCTNCGSANVQRDAWVHANDSDNVQTFDDTYCENCESPCTLKTVEVPDDFDIYNDFYKKEG